MTNNALKKTGTKPRQDQAAADSRIIAIAEEAFNNTSGSDQLVRVRAAKGHLAAA